MPSNQIQLKWVAGFSLREMQEALDDIQKAPTIPVVTTTMNVKGNMPLTAIRELHEICQKHGLELKVTLTASWEAGEQLKLAWPEE